jgi:hypothetical protein
MPLSIRLATFLAALALGNFTACANEIVTLCYEERCILRAVANRMGVSLRQSIPVPAVRYGSTTPLSEFQNAAESEWNIRPTAVSNGYFAGRNVIFLTDEPVYYENGMTLDEALAHEYTHFIQVRYREVALEDYDHNESEAIRVEFWFRETFMSDPSPSRNPCITVPP